LHVSRQFAHPNREFGRQLEYLTDVVAMIVGDEKDALGQVATRQALDMKRTRRREAWKLFAVIDKHLPAIMLVFGDAATNFMGAAVDGDSHYQIFFYLYKQS
jgi:hypothetical protein